MIRPCARIALRRFYHDSTFKSDRRVKLSSSHVSKELRRRQDADARPRDRRENPVRQFEPFPFAVTEENKLEALNRVVVPLSKLPYQEQLEGKEAHCRNSLRRFAQQLYKSGTPIRLDLRRLPCPVNPIVGTDVIRKYRNREEMSIWTGCDGKTPTVGYMIFPISKHGDTVCVEPNGCEVIRDEVAKACDLLQSFIRHQAKLPVCYSIATEGGWRRFIVRTNNKQELMVIGILNPRTLKVSQVLEDRDNFKEYMIRRCEELDLNLKSLYYQPCPHANCKGKDVPFELLHGEPRIEETFNGLRIANSPESFTHHNTSGAELLYNSVGKTIENCFNMTPTSTQKPLIIDAKSGAGVLALQLAKYASKLIGVDVSRAAVEDAKLNAELNGIKNAEFIHGNLEIILERMLEKHAKPNMDVLVVSDTPRAGLHRNITDVLRQSRAINKMIYISSKADSDGTIKNLTSLCEKQPGRSLPPFVPISATPVDVYPMVDACHLVIALERMPT